MKQGSTLASKLIRIGASLLAVALASISLTLWVTWQLEGGAAAVNEAGRMRMQTWRLVSTVQTEHQPGDVLSLVNQFDQSLALLRSGDAARPLFVPWDESVSRQFTRVESIWLHQRGQWLNGEHIPPSDAIAATSEFVHAIDGFVLAIEHQLSRLTAILNLSQFVMMVLAIGGAVLVLYTGYQYVINPLANLHQGLHKVEEGDFTSRVEVDTQDEFGKVATGFNLMASRLQSLYEGLEAQVVAKTQHIESQRARIEALYELSAFLAGVNKVEDLSKGFAQRVRAVMKADAVAVRWLDEANQRYLILASDCFPQSLLEAERSVLVGACACGNLALNARTRVIPIAVDSVEPARLCSRAGFQSLVSVPIRLQQRLIGEIDLLYRNPVELNHDEMELLDTMASHLASAMEGFRAAALEREAAVGEERALLARELHDSIAQSLAFLKIQVQLARVATQREQATQLQTALNELDEGLRESINDVRELLVHFRTRTNTEDVESALQETLQKFRHQTGLQALLQVQGEGLPLPADVQIQVLHVVQEALSNVRKHAVASQVSLEVSKGSNWHFVVRDNGAGFDIVQSKGEGHVGLKIMKERAQQIGATVEVSSSPGQGTSVTLFLPEHPVSGVVVSADPERTVLSEPVARI